MTNSLRAITLLAAAIVACAGCGEEPELAGSLTAVNASNFRSVVLQSDKPVLLEFTSPSCAPCEAMAPALRELAERHGDRIRFAKVTVEENLPLAAEFQVREVPTLLLIDKGFVAHRRVGLQSQQDLEALVAPYVGAP
jgi:thioredoxin 1